MSNAHFPGSGYKLGGASPPRLPSPTSPAPARTLSPSSPNQLGGPTSPPKPLAPTKPAVSTSLSAPSTQLGGSNPPRPPSPLPVASTSQTLFPNFHVTDDSQNVTRINTGGFTQHYGVKVELPSNRRDMLNGWDLNTTDNSFQHRKGQFGAGEYTEHYGAQIDEYGSSSSRSSSPSSQLPPRDPPAYTQVPELKERPMTRGPSGRSRNELSSEVASIYSQDPIPPSERRPKSEGGPPSRFESTESFAEIMNNLRSKTHPIWKDEPPPRPETQPGLLHLEPTRPLSSPRISTGTEEQPVIPPRGSGGDHASITTSSSSSRRPSLSRSPSRSSSSSSRRSSFSEGHHDPNEPTQITPGPRSDSPKPINEQDPPSRLVHDQRSNMTEKTEKPSPAQQLPVNETSPQQVEGSIPSSESHTKELKKSKKKSKKKKEAGCGSCCIIC